MYAKCVEEGRPRNKCLLIISFEYEAHTPTICALVRGEDHRELGPWRKEGYLGGRHHYPRLK